MKRLLVALILLSGCGAWQINVKNRLDNVHQATSAISQAIMPTINNICRKAAVGCAERGDETCLPLVKCDEVRDNFARSIVALYYALLAADTALAVDDEEAALQAVGRAIQLISQIRKDMAEIGLK